MDHTENNQCPIGLTKEEISKTYETSVPKKCLDCDNYIYENGILSCRLIME